MRTSSKTSLGFALIRFINSSLPIYSAPSCESFTTCSTVMSPWAVSEPGPAQHEYADKTPQKRKDADSFAGSFIFSLLNPKRVEL